MLIFDASITRPSRRLGVNIMEWSAAFTRQ
jgi:hypothetical protein